MEIKKTPVVTTNYQYTYISDDGKEFSTRYECEKYEQQKKIEAHPVFVSKIEGIYSFYDDYNAALYYLRNEDDYDFLVDNIIWNPSPSAYEFKDYGPGWYITWTVPGGDWADEVVLLNYRKYLEEIKTTCEKWEQDNKNKIQEKELELFVGENKRKLWVDDIRKPPNGYIWCSTVNGTITLLEDKWNEIGLIDMDHDAGDCAVFGGDYIKILDWIEASGMDASHITFRIHTQNPVGRENMRRIIQKNGWREIM